MTGGGEGPQEADLSGTLLMRAGTLEELTLVQQKLVLVELGRLILVSLSLVSGRLFTWIDCQGLMNETAAKVRT